MPNETEVDDEIIETNLPPEEEIQRLRKTNKSILAKSYERKSRIVELETENGTLKTKADAAEAKAQEAIVGIPLRKLAADMSHAPGLFLREFEARYKVESIDDVLVVSDHAGNGMKDTDGKPVAFEAPALWRLLTGGASNYAKTEDTATFGLLLKWQGPSGSGASGGGRGGSGHTPASTRKPDQKPAPLELGLK